MFIVIPVDSFSKTVGEITIIEGKVVIILILFGITLLIVILITFGMSYEVSYYIIGPLRDLLKKLR